MKRQSIISAVKIRFQGITKAHGYSSDIGVSVVVNNATKLSAALTQEINITDPHNSPADEEHPLGTFRWALTIELEIMVKNSVSAETMRAIFADIYKAIGTDISWGGLADRTEQPSDEMDIEQAKNKVSGARVTFIVIYDTPLWEM